MKKIVAVMAILASGCTTTIREMREHSVRASYVSPRSEGALEHCLAGNLSWVSNPAIIHGESSTELSFGSGGSIALLVTLAPTDGGTKVEVRELLAYGARIRHNVEACVSGKDV